MSTHFLFPALLLLLIVSSCQDQDPVEGPQAVDLDIIFQGTYDSEPLVMYDQAYDYENNMSLKFQLFQFYISDLSLLREEKSDGDSLKLVDIALISFKDVLSEADAAQGIHLSVANVPTGTYKGIKFGIGVSSDLNKTQPGDYTPPHPLDDHYWSWARGYVFSKIEGNADLDADGVYDQKLTFHIGENDFYREKVMLREITVDEDHQNLELVVDLQKVLVNAKGDFLNFAEVSQDHTNNMEVARFISDNLENAISIK